MNLFYRFKQYLETNKKVQQNERGYKMISKEICEGSECKTVEKKALQKIHPADDSSKNGGTRIDFVDKIEK